MADMRWSIWDGSHQMGLRRLIHLFQKPHLKPRKTSLLILATQIWGRAARVSPSDANLNNKAKYALKTLTHAKKNIEPGKFWYFVWNFSPKTCRHFWKQLHHCQVQSCTLCSQPSHWTFIVFFSGDFNVKAYLKVTQSVSQCPMALSPPSPSPPPPWWPSSSPSWQSSSSRLKQKQIH